MFLTPISFKLPHYTVALSAHYIIDDLAGLTICPLHYRLRPVAFDVAERNASQNLITIPFLFQMTRLKERSNDLLKSSINQRIAILVAAN
jgi:hypothetical protein